MPPPAIFKTRYHVGAVAFLILIASILFWYRLFSPASYSNVGRPDRPKHLDQQHLRERFDLTRHECVALFPRLFTEIDIAKSRGRIGVPPKRDDKGGFARARIHNGRLYVLNRGADVHHRQYAILSQINRALTTAPRGETVPDIEFTFCVNDHPQDNIWSLTRSDDPREVNSTWVIPDYGYWAWPEPAIPPLNQLREAVAEQEAARPWVAKVDKAVWRGTVHWNKDLRGELLKVSTGKPWADIEELKWKKNDLRMHEFCDWKYLVYTEGVTYSGRLKYLLLCGSIVVTPAISWRTFLSPMLEDDGDQQNIVTVRRDWSDLEEKIEWLANNPRVAEHIAWNAARTFRDVYMAPGAETCYWRELFRAWDEVTDPVVGKAKGRDWESFMLMGELDWDKYA